MSKTCLPDNLWLSCFGYINIYIYKTDIMLCINFIIVDDLNCAV